MELLLKKWKKYINKHNKADIPIKRGHIRKNETHRLPSNRPLLMPCPTPKLLVLGCDSSCHYVCGGYIDSSYEESHP